MKVAKNHLMWPPRSCRSKVSSKARDSLVPPASPSTAMAVEGEAGGTSESLAFDETLLLQERGGHIKWFFATFIDPEVQVGHRLIVDHTSELVEDIGDLRRGVE